LSENTAPAAQVNWARAVWLCLPLPAALVPLLVFSLERNGSDVAGSHPWLTYLIRSGARGIIARINRLTAREQREVPVPWRAVVGEGVEAGVARQVTGLQGDSAAGRVTNQVGVTGVIEGKFTVSYNFLLIKRLRWPLTRCDTTDFAVQYGYIALSV
jgi:hypothetical protein